MKKIGVLTFHRSLNYGAILQAYGLVKTIQSLGYNCELMDYRNSELEKRDSVKRFYSTRGVVRSLYQLLESPYWYQRRKKFDRFLNNAQLSTRMSSISEETCSDYQCFFVGSDQVWNYKITGNDTNYLFSAINENIKKNSYAASFGVSELPKAVELTYQKELSTFNNVSVREEEGAEIVTRLTNEKPLVVLDPSLLLNKKEWLVASKVKKVTEGDYIVVYQRAYSKTLIDFAKKLAKKHHCELVTITGNPKQSFGMVNVLNAGPEEWLDLINNATFVVTNSFHGIAFSINFNKQFYFELLDEKFGVNSRLKNIISMFSIENRAIKDMRIETEQEEIDYSTINLRLEELRAESLGFIERTIVGSLLQESADVKK